MKFSETAVMALRATAERDARKQAESGAPAVSYANSELLIALVDERDELREMILDLFVQGASVSQVGPGDPKYDHMCISSYEDAQDKLIEWGLLAAKDCARS